MNVSEASAARQSAADRKNSLDAQLRDLRADERARSERIGRAIADGADPASLAEQKAERDEIRSRIEDLTSAESHLDTDFAVAEDNLRAAAKAERQAALNAVIEKARAGAKTY